MSSTRLPGKVLMELPFGSGGQPLLAHVIQGLRAVEEISRIVIATTDGTENDSIQQFALKYGTPFFRGSENNVIGRFISCAAQNGISTIVRVTADNPLVAEVEMSRLISSHLSGKFDYSCSVNLPLGMNIEVVSTDALIQADTSSDITDFDREHVTTYVKKNQRFKKQVVPFGNINLTDRMRLTVDYPNDLALMSLVIQWGERLQISGMQLVQRLDRDFPWLWKVNNGNLQIGVDNLQARSEM